MDLSRTYRGSHVSLWPLVNPSSPSGCYQLFLLLHLSLSPTAEASWVAAPTRSISAIQWIMWEWGVQKIAQHCHAKHRHAAPLPVHWTVCLGQRWNEIVLNRQKVLSLKKEIKFYSNLAFGITGALREVFTNTSRLSPSLAWMWCDLCHLDSNNCFSFSLRPLIWPARLHQEQRADTLMQNYTPFTMCNSWNIFFIVC